jgi:hypothetical protein
MATNLTIPKTGLTNLTVVNMHEEKEPADAKLIPITKKEKRTLQNMPPEREQYIKAKKHDFL